MDLIISTPEQIEAIFDKCLAKVNLTSKPEPPKHPEVEQPIPQPEAIEFMGKSRQTFSKWRKKGIIKGHVIGGRIYYFRSELIAAMK